MLALLKSQIQIVIWFLTPQQAEKPLRLHFPVAIVPSPSLGEISQAKVLMQGR